MLLNVAALGVADVDQFSIACFQAFQAAIERLASTPLFGHGPVSYLPGPAVVVTNKIAVNGFPTPAQLIHHYAADPSIATWPSSTPL